MKPKDPKAVTAPPPPAKKKPAPPVKQTPRVGQSHCGSHGEDLEFVTDEDGKVVVKF